MLNSRQRAQLRGMANGYETIVHIGKSGITDTVIKQVRDALEARELIKCCVLENAPLTVRESADSLSDMINADVVQVIGSKFILYKQSSNKDNRKIALVK